MKFRTFIKEGSSILINSTLFIALFLGFSGSLKAQKVTLTKDDQIRVTSTDFGLHKKKMTFTSFQNEQLLLSADKNYEIPFNTITHLEVLRGKKSSTKKGALIGIAAGAGIGAAIGAGVNCYNLYDGDVSEMRCVGIFGGLGAAGGLLVGAVVGGVIKTDNWVEIPRKELRMQIVPQVQSGLGLGLLIHL